MLNMSSETIEDFFKETEQAEDVSPVVKDEKNSWTTKVLEINKFL